MSHGASALAELPAAPVFDQNRMIPPLMGEIGLKYCEVALGGDPEGELGCY